VVTVNKVPSELNIPENGNIIELNKADAEKIFENAVAGLPNEACGLLGGAVENDVIVIKEVYVLKYRREQGTLYNGPRRAAKSNKRYAF
jgi:hypothetical protein